ncbi:MAG: hypothetical protein A3G81_02800 [Betaproteobacteria bacterium RIFCSPLOWO2_12_FULL_65_14]|nr:MAG: hypothetical protein A3G81_02800 [Betaproteobacteria bacterium RIFCSPLOWO2_12_FULL_65_14]
MLHMKTLKRALVAAAVAAFALAAAAQDEQARALHPAEPRAPSYVDARMTHLEAELDALEAQMKQVGAVSDAAERSRLLGRHARALRQVMKEVRELDRSLSPQMRAMMGGGTQEVSAEKMMLVHDLIARRVALMERLTEQVMEQSMGHGAEAPRS